MKRLRAQKQAEREAAAEKGTLNVVTPDGWAVVYNGRRRLGTTPLRTELPVGRHVLEVRPFNKPPGRRVSVKVTADGANRTVVRLSD